MDAAVERRGRETRLIADTCAALKLLGAGEIFFKDGARPIGKLVLHPRLFNETKRWTPAKKKKYQAELALAGKIRAAAGIA
jgi:hypothetical protein